jgi:ubiquinone/menaquinone biosynthesis C-methylase UbiE
MATGNPKDTKEFIKLFWNGKPCGTLGFVPEDPDPDYFENIRRRRYKLEPFIFELAGFDVSKGKRVLEIGCGVGTDGVEFLKAGADYTGVDASDISVGLAKKNLKSHGYSDSFIRSADAEQLPFPDNHFDFVYSWGVLHHTPDLARAVSEVYRVLKPGGRFCIMLYNRRSLVGFQLYVLHGLLKLRPLISWRELFSGYHESPGTKALSFSENKDLFGKFHDVEIKDVITPYDLRIARNIFLPKSLGVFIPSALGFFRVTTGTKK